MEDRVRQDFPIDWEEDNYVSRREFFKFLTLASGGLAIGSATMAVWSKFPREERRFDPMMIAEGKSMSPGSAVSFNYPRMHDLCILIRKPNGEYVAYSRRCTHLSCPVNYEPDNDRLYCPCHNGAFAVDDGRVLQGPPPHPLPRILLEERSGEIWAVGVTLKEEA
ncbi:MAG: Rieske 2Fe-2S domain-containing protein [Fimbriimonadales bacterium]|nr:Rieske 2Fe-2S domain-containing protein [Fimbriimonadales bacterium]